MKEGIKMAEKKKGVSRRDFLKTAGIATGAVVGGGLVGGLVGYNIKQGADQTGSEEGHGTAHEGVENRGRMFFTTNNEFNVLSQAVERIFPEDDLGPGAIGLGVPYFIDNQLAGGYGQNAREYRQGPFYEGAPTQGYQSRLTRAEAFLQGIKKIDEEARTRFDDGFANLEGEQMDEILTAFQKGEVEMRGISSSAFFQMLRQATIEGAYADPLYNGNINMDGWRMKDFPGHQMAYISEIESEEFIKIEPQSLTSMDH